MRLLVDECLSSRPAPWPNGTSRHDAVRPLHVGRRGLPDHRVLAWCSEEDRVIVAENGWHFRRLVAGTEPHPGVIVRPSPTREATWRLPRLGLEHLGEQGEPSDVMVGRVLEVDPEGRCTLHALPPAADDRGPGAARRASRSRSEHRSRRLRVIRGAHGAMASKTALNACNLEALGAARLARLLMELSEGDGAAQRRLRLELAAGQGAGEVARAVRRRLGQVARARGYVDWHRRRPLIDDLDAHRRAIARDVAPEDPAEALDLMWRFSALAASMHERCDDGDGLVGNLFREALADLGEAAAAARPDPEGLADHAFGALQDNGYAQYDGLVAALAPALGERGLAHLEDHLRAWAVLPAEERDGDDGAAERVASGADGPSGRVLRERRGTARLALADIADARGDADGFAAQFNARDRRSPVIAAAIAERLLGAGRAAEALAMLDGAQVSRWLAPPSEWHDARLDALDALGRGADAQAARWARFEAALSEDDLRAYLGGLPDFEDIEAEERALDQVARHPDVHAALVFLVRWPAHARAAALVLCRADELDGNAYWVLTPAAEALAERHPLAATLCLRAMIGFALGEARSSRYRHAARHLVECAELAPRIADWGPAPPHHLYLAGLRAEHGRRAGFWAAVEEAQGR